MRSSSAGIKDSFQVVVEAATGAAVMVSIEINHRESMGGIAGDRRTATRIVGDAAFT